MPVSTYTDWSENTIRRYAEPGLSSDELRTRLISDGHTSVTETTDSGSVYAAVLGIVGYHALEVIRGRVSAGTVNDTNGCTQSRCARCDDTAFAIWHDPKIQHSFIHCVNCNAVLGRAAL